MSELPIIIMPTIIIIVNMNASVFDQSAHLTKWSMSRIQTHLGYVHMVLNIFSTCQKFQPDILFPWNHVKVSFCSDGTDNRMNFGTFFTVLSSPHAQNAS